MNVLFCIMSQNMQSQLQSHSASKCYTHETFIRNTILILGRDSLCSQSNFSSFVVWFPQDFGNIPLRFWSIFLWLHDIISADLSAAHSRCQSLILLNHKVILLDSDLVTEEAIEVHWIDCHVHETSLWWLLLCDMISKNSELDCGIEKMMRRH